MARTVQEIQDDLDQAQRQLSRKQEAVDGFAGELQLVTSGVEKGDVYAKGRRRFEVLGYNAGLAKVVGMLFSEGFEIDVAELTDAAQWTKK